MNERRTTTKSNNKSQISQIHSSLLELYNYLKMDKLQIVSKNIFNNLKSHSFNIIAMSRQTFTRDIR